MKIFSLCLLCLNLCFSAANWEIIAKAKDPTVLAKAHLRLANQSQSYALTELWHLRRSLQWNPLPETTKKIAGLTQQPTSSITNDEREQSALITLIPSTEDKRLKQRRIISLYHLCMHMGFGEIPLDLFETPHPLVRPFHGLVRFAHPPPESFRIATFGSCLSQRTANALLYLLGLPLDETHYDLSVQFCRSDRMLAVLFEKAPYLRWEDIYKTVKDKDIFLWQFPEKNMGKRRMGSLGFWANRLHIEEKGVFKKIKQAPHVILLDSFFDLKALYSIHKETGFKLFCPRWFVDDFDSHFTSESQHLDPLNLHTNFNIIFSHLHTLYPQAHIVFFHFPFNLDPNPRVRTRSGSFKEQFTGRDYVTIFDVPVERKDLTDSPVHFTPWYYEKLAHMVWMSMHEKGAAH